jgi:hypothetical protein
MNEPIRGKVARILNSREIVINVGSAVGVHVGMYFEVMNPKGEDITDPDSGAVLGSLQRPKVRVKITKIQEKLSVASTYRKKKINIGGEGPDFGAIGLLSKSLSPQKWIEKYETLKTNEKTWEDLDERESYVKIGDPVVQVIEADDEKEESSVG